MAEYDQHAPPGTSVGERLRAAREARSLTLDDVASQTRIPIRHLRHIEDSQWAELPAVTYTVGFARNYANAVGLDGAAIGRELRDQIGGVDRASQISPDVYAQSDPARAPSRTLAWIAAFLVVAMIAGYLIWRGQLRDDDANAAAPPPASDTAEAAPAPQPPQPAAPAAVTGQPVTLVASADVWMSVTDRGASNRRLYYNTLRQGERFQVPGDAVRPVIFTTNPQNLRVSIGSQERGQLAAQRGRINDQSLKAEDLAALPSLAGQPPGAPAPGQGNGLRPML